jgi:hypothetical protein
VRRRNEDLQVFGRAIASLRRERVDAVITPVAGARRLRQRHQLDRGNAEIGEIAELFARRGVGPRLREAADMEFVGHDLFPGSTAPIRIGPVEGLRIDDLARAMDIGRLKSRGRVGHRRSAIDDIEVSISGERGRRRQAEPAGVSAFQREQSLAAGPRQ